MNHLLKVYLILFISYICLVWLDRESLSSIQTLVGFSFFFLTVYYAVRILRRLFRRLLWRIRRKLILSYIFIGLIPICLLILLFMLASFIFLGQTTSEMFVSSLDGLLLQTKNENEKLLHFTESLGAREALDKWRGEWNAADQEWLSNSEIFLSTPESNRVLQGSEWKEMPAWLSQKNFSGMVIRDSTPFLAAVHHNRQNERSLHMLVPVDSGLLDLIKKRVDADIHYVSFSSGEGAKDEFDETIGSSRSKTVWPKWWDFPILWFSLPDQYNWYTGKRISVLQESGSSEESVVELENQSGSVEVTTTVEDKESKPAVGAFVVSTHFSRIYSHIFARSTDLQKFVYAVLFSVAVFFLIIELISLISGFLLARSITASVHNLFEGTERIKRGDLNYQIKINAKDQLGDLAQSFNSMTESVKTLLKERAEKERLAESLRIARQMQENLLPKEVVPLEGLELAAMNLPAQEVCGDYYDILTRDGKEMGIIIADVSGKGPSAALYMAEAKGVILSLSKQTVLPRQLLVEVNKILGPTLDSRSFITMTYAIIQMPEKLMRMSRAGHNPILHYSATSGTMDVVKPAGIGLGLGKNGIFDRTLEEVEKKLDSGDILVFYTDGLTEAMNGQNQLYGMNRLSQIILQNTHRSAEEMKAAILHDLEEFLHHKLPQDDVTLVLLKII